MPQQIKYPDKRIRMNKAEITALVKLLESVALESAKTDGILNYEEYDLIRDFLGRLRYGKRGPSRHRLEKALEAEKYQYPCVEFKNSHKWERMKLNEQGEVCIQCKYPCNESKSHWVDIETHFKG